MLDSEQMLFLAAYLQIDIPEIESMIKAKNKSILDMCAALVREEIELKECNDPRFCNGKLIIAQGIMKDLVNIMEGRVNNDAVVEQRKIKPRVADKTVNRVRSNSEAVLTNNKMTEQAMLEKLNIENNIMSSIEVCLRGYLNTSEIELRGGDIFHAIYSILRDLFWPDSDSQGFSFTCGPQKTPAGLGDNVNYHGLINVIPSNIFGPITETLVVFCLGTDNLNNRLEETIHAVGTHKFTNVIFVTSNWNMSALTGKNIKRSRDLMELKRAGTKFCFVLLSTCGTCFIPVSDCWRERYE